MPLPIHVIVYPQAITQLLNLPSHTLQVPKMYNRLSVTVATATSTKIFLCNGAMLSYRLLEELVALLEQHGFVIAVDELLTGERREKVLKLLNNDKSKAWGDGMLMWCNAVRTKPPVQLGGNGRYLLPLPLKVSVPMFNFFGWTLFCPPWDSTDKFDHTDTFTHTNYCYYVIMNYYS
eukprot:15192132-Ditylum_brightwellii.AAC.1